MSQTPNREAVEKIVLLLVSGVSAEAAEAAAIHKLGVDADEAGPAVEAAKQKIANAAAFDRTAEAGTAYVRLQDIYSRAIKAQDTKTALAAQKELNRLLALYDPTQPLDAGEDPTEIAELRETLDAIREHLQPLKLAPDDYPLHEHARIAADLIRQTRDA